MHGIILIDKPAGITSAEVVRRIKARVKPSRVGHLGTLDPFATGVLPILVGDATKLAPMLEGGEKEYEGLIRLGQETDTLDRDGKVVREAAIPSIGEADLRAVERRFSGRIEQTPPIYSALKRGGVRLYELARRGVEVEPPAPRMVEIKRISLALEAPDALRFSAVCSPGTYARALARDIGVALATVAHLFELRRIRNGNFHLKDAISLDDAIAALASRGEIPLIPLREALGAMPEVAVDERIELRLRNGDARALDGTVPAGAETFKIVREGRLIAVARATSRVTAVIVRVFSPV
jgi:tRNA pseudouridine55 synthase